MANEIGNEGLEARVVGPSDGVPKIRDHGRSGPEHGLVLRDAVERYVDAELLNAYRRAAAQLPKRRPPVRSSFMDRDRVNRPLQSSMSQETYIRLRRERDRARKLVLDNFKSQLLSGDLVATGYECPERLVNERAPIPPEKWTRLKLNFRDNSVSRDELKIIDVRVHRAGEPTAQVPLPDQISPLAEEPSRKSGRPNQMQSVKAIMVEWYEKGELGPNWTRQSKLLAKAYEKIHGQQCNSETVRRQLGADYNALMRGKKPG